MMALINLTAALVANMSSEVLKRKAGVARFKKQELSTIDADITANVQTSCITSDDRTTRNCNCCLDAILSTSEAASQAGETMPEHVGALLTMFNNSGRAATLIWLRLQSVELLNANIEKEVLPRLTIKLLIEQEFEPGESFGTYLDNMYRDMELLDSSMMFAVSGVLGVSILMFTGGAGPHLIAATIGQSQLILPVANSHNQHCWALAPAIDIDVADEDINESLEVSDMGGYIVRNMLEIPMVKKVNYSDIVDFSKPLTIVESESAITTRADLMFTLATALNDWDPFG